jgi:hypothetical protein
MISNTVLIDLKRREIAKDDQSIVLGFDLFYFKFEIAPFVISRFSARRSRSGQGKGQHQQFRSTSFSSKRCWTTQPSIHRLA